MKSPYLLFLLIIILFLSCAENQEDQILNMGEQGFLLDRSIFPRGNNVAKSAVVLEDTYLIGGQLFNKTDSSETESSIIKLSASGEIIKQVNFGGRRARLEYLLQTNDSKIIATGYQKGRFWLREIDQNLIVLFDSTYQDIDFNGPLGPIFFETQDGFLLISTSFRGGRRTVHFNSFSKDYKIVSHHTLEGFCEEHGVDQFGIGKYDF
ncbi:MAG: hypothetical protein HRT74_12130, partial [Flavobacteriales bacterium]|nr:hypothetical protein [Flavobacteriales bacterium]